MDRVNYVMVQITFAPCTFPNELLEQVLLNEADKYIKSNKMAKAGVIHFDNAPTELDYRWSACSNRKSPVNNELGGWDDNVEQVFYRILTNKRSALEFIKFNLNAGAKKARIITEDQCGVVEGIPNGVPFPTDERVQQFLWNQNEDTNKRVQLHALA